MKKLPENNRSECPLSGFLDILGDKWSLLIVRDMMFNGKKTFGEFLQAPEGIASNILTSRLVLLEKNGFIEKLKNPENKKVPIYKLTHKGRELQPILVEVYLWTEKYFPIPSDIKSQIQKYKKSTVTHKTSLL
ncbi:MAG TPA: helix-turn-helix domain-containing protein [Candidatus Saccharimonadales bacterium]|nr:helix-turn-helix domain-containing protein [Candidatus Saccharimonadales bacterium]